MNLIEELSCNGVPPTGPCSAWPQERNQVIHEFTVAQAKAEGRVHSVKVNASAGTMAKGLIKAAGQALTHGKVSKEIREERYETCKACPFFVEDSKRCSECGCFMEAKTWIGGNPDKLCPKQKWSR